MIDTQLHIIDPVRFPFPVPTRGYLPKADERATAETVLAKLDAHGIAGGVLVQASVYGLDNAAILAAVQAAPDRFRAVIMTNRAGLADAAANPAIIGVRLNLTDFAGHDEMPKLRNFAAEALEAGLALQVQARPRALTMLLKGMPAGVVILDHFGRPDLDAEDDLAIVAKMSDREGCYLKASGAFRLAGFDPTQRADPRLARLIDAFGPDRVVWGSDYPFLNLPHSTRPDCETCLADGHALLDMNRAAAAARRLFGWHDG